MNKENSPEIDTSLDKSAFYEGLRDGIPIGLGYFAVAFSLGIAYRNAGITAFQGFLTSITNATSAGQFAAVSIIAGNASYFEMALTTLIINARYFLMSAALSQKLSPKMPFFHRFLFGAVVTDELFGINIGRPGYLNPYYYYGAALAAVPSWATGTAVGIIAGNMLPQRIVGALVVALYGMFLAVIIPPARKHKIIFALVLCSFIASLVANVCAPLAALSGGTRIIVLTVTISAIAAWFFPADKYCQEVSADEK
ncbi:MAG: AzlC family ABC transporter permease [Phascolarctobacterium sp.]|nr:AzlC family ABC transporter permease [Phascolarctobacterium sp.]